MEKIDKGYLSQLGIGDEVAKLLIKYSEPSSDIGTKEGHSLLGHLKIDKDSSRLGLFQLKSEKLANLYFNWKTFLFETLPALTGALATTSQSEIAAALLGLQAIKSAAGLDEIKFDENHSKLILILHKLSLNERGKYEWVELDKLAKKLSKNKREIVDSLRYLERVGVVRFNLNDDSVIMSETIEFEGDEQNKS